MANAILAQLKKRREKSVELEAGKNVFFQRPPESDMPGLLIPVVDDPTKATWSVRLEHVLKYVTGWEGFTEATLLGAAIGGDDVVAFDKDLWAEVVGDNLEWQSKVARAILDAVVEHSATQEAVAKNSAPA